MNNPFYKITKGADQLRVGSLTVDLDPDCERLFIMDRTSGLILLYADKPLGNVFKGAFNHKYTLTNNLILGIIDSNNTYECKVIDAIMLESVLVPDLNL